MANVATMGPPPSPKEPRRSGRRSGPSTSTSKSPAGSPTSETGPKPKDNPQRSAPSSSNAGRNKRAKIEDMDDAADDNQKTTVNGTSNGRARRKADASLGDGHGQEEEEEEQGVTRCICQETGIDESEAGEFMAECELCHAWQHGTCMGYQSPETMPTHYYCERCRPDQYTELLKKHAKRARQSSTASHQAGTNPSRTSRSHSPTYLLKQPAKRRNTMNSRDAAYDESLQAVIQASAREAAAATAGTQDAASPAGTTKSEQTTSGHAEAEVEADNTSNLRRKRKRTDDDASSAKRTRSASITSELAHGGSAGAAETSPLTTTKVALPAMSSATTTATAKSSTGRTKRGGGRRGQAAASTAMQHSQVVERASVEGDNNEAVAGTSSATRRQGNTRAKALPATHEHGTRRNHAGAGSHSVAPGIHTPAAARAYHNTHAYAVSQQPLLTSWGLPDYLSHLEQMLPSLTPTPLEVRGFGTISNGQDMQDHTTERGVKVKWPSKRMSVGDMNKRVRALVEWVGREQATAAERTRRREAIESARQERHASDLQRVTENAPEPLGSSPMVLDSGAVTDSPVEELRQPPADTQSALFTLEGPGPDPGKSTMKMMEELMEELISFQERFGPGAKVKERERRTATS